MEPKGKHEQVWAEAREEAGEAGGLCAKVAEGPDDQDAVRVEAEEVVVGGIQLCGFNQLGGRGDTPRPFGEAGCVGEMIGRVCFVSVPTPAEGSWGASPRWGSSPGSVSRWPNCGPRQICGLLSVGCSCLHRARPGRGPLVSRPGLGVQGSGVQGTPGLEDGLGQ